MDHRWIEMHAEDDGIHTMNFSLKTSQRSITFQKFLAMQKLKKAALVVIAKNLTQDGAHSRKDSQIHQRNYS